jgi:hypothetical protein
LFFARAPLPIGARFLAARLFAEAGPLADVVDRDADAVAAFADMWPPNETMVKLDTTSRPISPRDAIEVGYILII